MNGIVFSIEEFSVFDGPGIRTTVFLKGCPLRCRWCHNPEGQKQCAEIIRTPNGCIDCKSCLPYIAAENDRYVFGKECVKVCPRELYHVCGEEYTPSRLCEKLLKNQEMLNDGGVTFSGGEPLYQGEFLCECLDYLGKRLHTAVQTSGFSDARTFENVLCRADYFLFDLKLHDRSYHIKYTGVPNDAIIANFKRLCESRTGEDFVVRIPLIPGVTDTDENLEGIARLLSENGVYYAELLPYNRAAGGKYASVGRVYSPGFDPDIQASFGEKIFSSYNIETNIL